MPAKWLGRTDTPQLTPDCGTRVLDYNAFQWLESPWEPGIRAVLHLQRNFDFTELDIITDRRQLACILELAYRKGEQVEKTHEGDERTADFRFGAQVLGETVIFVRTDDSTTIETIDQFRGFADEFKKKYFEYPDSLNDAKSYHRMVSSRLGNLRIMLRHGAEGYVPNDTNTLRDALANMQPAAVAQKDSDNITVMSGGALIPSSAIVELNTCSKTRDSSSRLAAKARECWLSQDAHFVTAKYTVTQQSKKAARNGYFTDLRGVFDPEDIKFHNVSGDTSDWAGENGEVIQEFHDLLLDLVERIRSAVAAGQGDKFLVEYGGEGMDIRISPSDTVRGMSDELCERIKVGTVRGT
jgi:hypothetical protein